LLDCISACSARDAGVIKFNDEYFFTPRAVFRCLRKCAALPTFFSRPLFPHLSVEENVAYGLSAFPSPERQERVERILPAFHIEALRRRKPANFPGEKSSGWPWRARW